ncbi:MAG: signal recognition particle protein [Defluviitaleaceae bacterium]|nr:signal recognition particle protein [Defluviitaleaceae bacterium]
MAFESLTDKLQNVFKKLRGKGRLTEKDVREAMREVRLALLEADVNFKIVKDFCNTVVEKAVGGSVLEGLNPGQQVIKIVNDELVNLLGSTQSKLTFASKPPTIYMMAGLNGAGKTTATGKLGAQLRKQGHRPLLVACDVYRPAAIKQLQVLGGGYNLPVYSLEGSKSPLEIAKASLKHAKDESYDVIILDTAGRFHVNEELMNELKEMKAEIRPQEILLVVDAMTGQDAVTVAEAFNAALGVDGIIISKLDSDTRGGAALSVRAVTGKPVKYVGMGEKIEDLEPFYPDRMAQRILGMGDVMSLIEKAQQAFDEKEAAELEKKMRTNEMNLEDFLGQLKQIKKMGPLKNILGMLPGMGQMKLDDAEVDEGALRHIEALICSMTPQERRNPNILSASRKRRIAAGSGSTVPELNRLLKQFEDMKRMVKGMMGPGKGKKGMGLPFMR